MGSSIFAMACGIFSCSTQTLSRGMWDLLLQSGIEPRAPALESRVLATGPPEKSPPKSLLIFVITVRLKICWVISPMINLLLGFAKFSLLLPGHIHFSHLCLVRPHLHVHWNNKQKLFERLSYPFLRVNTFFSLSLACSASFSGKSGWIYGWLALR